MGNSFTCIPQEEEQKKKSSSSTTKYVRRFSLIPSFRRRTLLHSLSCSSSSSSSKKVAASNKKKKTREKKQDHRGQDKDSMIQEQTLSATNILFSQTPRSSSSVPFRRSSTSVVTPSPTSSAGGGGQNAKKASCGFIRSSSSRQRSSKDFLLKPNQLVPQDHKVDDRVETKRFVLVHGGGYGAWCWYKTMTLLEKEGFQVDAVDLTGSGVSSSDTNSITSLAQYVKPVIQFLDNLKAGEKVILVGHDFGGACISYIMEMFPSKIAKSVFIAAAMLTSGKSILDLFTHQPTSNDLMQQAHMFLYANGKKNPPTAVDFNRSLLRDFLFNRSPTKDVALASVSMRPIPFAPVVEKLNLTEKNYGSVPRFYIKTTEDFAVPVSLQEAMIKTNPPVQVFQLKGSDHSPFFSRPQSLNRILVEISQIPSKKTG